MKKKFLVAAGGSTLVLGGLVTGLVAAPLIGKTYADEASDYPPIIKNLAEHFGSEPTEVLEVFEATKEEHREDRMDDLVADGIITEAQKDLIMEHQEETRAKKEEIFNSEMTVEERREAMQELRSELETWAEENNIPEEALRKGKGGPRMGVGSHNEMGLRKNGLGGMGFRR